MWFCGLMGKGEGAREIGAAGCGLDLVEGESEGEGGWGWRMGWMGLDRYSRLRISYGLTHCESAETLVGESLIVAGIPMGLGKDRLAHSWDIGETRSLCMFAVRSCGHFVVYFRSTW